MRPELPTGTVTFLFTDVAGSTSLLEEIGDEAYEQALAEHRRVVRAASGAHGGAEVDTQGDAFFFSFRSAPGALAAASEMTSALEPGPIRIRIGLHTGEARLGEEGYVGREVHFAARVAATGHGGQIVLSSATAALLPSDTVSQGLVDLGEHRLKDIEGPVQIFQFGTERFPPLKTISNTNLPRPASSFVGRERELSEVLAKIEQGARLLTLTGPGGSGKTRLALEAAATLVPDYKAGVFWIGLASLRDPALVAETISQTLGAKDGLAEHIEEREMLLLLDNLEQVVEAAPELSRLLQSCPNLTLLCTSRELLRTQGEIEYEVPPLAEPESVALFSERTGLDPSEEIAELCARLDNLPLAVELAAARTKALTPAQILERISQRLDLLKGGRDADPRQQTLRATIAWSYDLLTEEERRLFRALSVFAGGCTLEAAEEVADADLDTLQSLVEKSLLRFSNSRFWMLETIREYAGERLAESAESESVRARQVSWLQALVVRARETIFDFETMAMLDDELANLRGVVGWLTLRGAGRELLHLGAYTWIYLLQRSPGEGRALLESALGMSRDETEERARALTGLSALAQATGDLAAAERSARECLALSRRIGLRRGERGALVALGLVHTQQGRFDEAESFYQESARVAESIGDTDGIREARGALADLALNRGDFELAEKLARDAVPLFGENDSQRPMMLFNVAFAALKRGARGVSLEATKEGLSILDRSGPTFDLRCALEVLASLAAGYDTSRAALLLSASEALESEYGVLPAFELSVRRETLHRVEDTPPDVWRASWERGTQLDPPGALDVALDASEWLTRRLS